MGKCNSFCNSACSYSTPKLIRIHSVTVGIVSRIVQVIIVAYIIGFVIIYKKGYQDVSLVESATTTKLKGVAFTNFTDDQFNPAIKHPGLYRRVWDVAEYVVPPSANGATFVATNVVITANQTQSVCPEDITVPGAKCDPSKNTCVRGQFLTLGNGVMTGNCVKFNDEGYSCEIHAWCPVENDVLPLKNDTALLEASQNFTLLIKNFVNFPKFANSMRRNIKDTDNITYLEHCRYDSKENPECPIFRLGDTVKWAGLDYREFSLKGGVIAIIIDWDCNLDFDKKYCFATYKFTRLVDSHVHLAPGWNFRYAQYYNDNGRTLYKLYGIKFAIIVQGQARKFSIVPFLLNVGAGLGLLALEVVICDLVVLCLMKKRQFYKSKKYEDVGLSEDEDESLLVVPAEGGDSTAKVVDDEGDGCHRNAS